jgi:hypothetical protein
LANLKLVEHRSIDYVLIAERHGKVSDLWPMWFSGEAHLAAVASGVVGAALGSNFIWMSIAVILGCALGTFFMAFHSTQGPQLGLPQMIQSRPQFGYIGALLLTVGAFESPRQNMDPYTALTNSQASVYASGYDFVKLVTPIRPRTLGVRMSFKL